MFPVAIVWYEGSIKSGPTLNGWTFSSESAFIIPVEIVVFPTALPVPANTSFIILHYSIFYIKVSYSKIINK